jgi:acyl CoA:acetate/3-ketoacid CoA transferase beta subunit
VDFVTSPGFLEGHDSRISAGLIFGGPYKVVTDLGTMKFDPTTKRLVLEAVQKGVETHYVQENTGFDLPLADSVQETPPPTRRELNILKAIDPEKVMLRGG